MRLKFNYLLLMLGLTLGLSACSEKQTQSPQDAVLQNIMTRTSIRSYQDRPVEAEKVDLILKAGMAAPTAVNRQPWAFVVVDDKEVLQQLLAKSPRKTLSTAPMGIVVCGDMQKALEGPAQEFWVQDASAATQNILLAAHALGLGAVWTGGYPLAERVEATRSILGLPEYIIPLDVILIGYAAEEPTPKDKWKPENVHYNGW